MKPNTATKPGTAVFIGFGRRLGWVASCTAAAAVGIALVRPLAEHVREPLSQIVDGLPTMALFGGCLGVVQALVQWGSRRRQSGPHTAWWMLATSVSGALGYVLGVKLATAVTDPIRGQVLVYVSEALGYLVLGAVLGLVFGVVQGGLRRASGQGMAGWIALSTLGWRSGSWWRQALAC